MRFFFNFINLNIFSALNGGECFMSQDQVNPLGLLVRPGVQEMSLDSIRTENAALNNLMASKSSSYIVKNSSTGYYQNRVRKELNYVVGAETYTKDNGKHLEIVKMVRLFYISCNIGNPKCLLIIFLAFLELFIRQCKLFQVSMSNQQFAKKSRGYYFY